MPTTHVVTVHFRSPRWVDLQRSYLQKNISAPFKVYTYLDEVSSEVFDTLKDRFDYCGHSNKSHGDKLDDLVEIVAQSAAPEDFLLFLDGDAFPIRPLPLERLAEEMIRPLWAAQRLELGDRGPHPLFCLTTVKFWTENKLSWKLGTPWVNDFGETVNDPGGLLMQQLEDLPMWLPLNRTRSVSDHPVHYGIYGNYIYHHGSGFSKHGPGGLTRWDIRHYPDRESRKIENKRLSCEMYRKLMEDQISFEENSHHSFLE